MPLAPKDLTANLRYRRAITELGNSSKEAQVDIWSAASRNPIWFIDTFCWTSNFKDHPANPDRPFITYNYQEDACRRIKKAIGKHDLIVPKSRAMGGTYIILATMLHGWLFQPKQNYLLASAKEDRVDKRGDPSSLFWKLDNMIENLPKWMIPDFDRVELKLINNENGSVFAGESTNKNVDRGGRRTAILADEAAAMANAELIAQSIQHVTNTCIWLSTFAGAYGHFFKAYEKWSREHPEWVIRMHWTQHPVYSIGITRDAAGKWTSPWYEHECSRTPSKRAIAQEIDMDPQAAGGQYFGTELREKCLQMMVLDPFFVGDLEGDSFDKPVWASTSRGRLLLWCHVGDDGKPPIGKYVIGYDIATGKGGSQSSQSCAAVYDAVTGEKVAEFKDSKITPTTFARYASLLGRWFYNAKMIWGSLGPGSDFGKTLIEDCQYGNVYFRVEEGKVNKKRTKKYGYPEQGEYRANLFSTYYDALETAKIINRSRGAIEELAQFIFSPGGDVQHSEAIQREQDPENAGKLHGDIVIADAMANVLLRECRAKKPKAAAQPIFDPRTATFNKYSAGWRYQQIQAKKKKKAYY